MSFNRLLKQTADHISRIEELDFQKEIEMAGLSNDDLNAFYNELIKQIESAALTNEKRESLYATVVKLHVPSILAINEKERTHTVYLEAVRTTSEALEIIPELMRDYEIYYACVSHQNTHHPNAISSISQIPFHMRDFKMCAAFINQSGFFLKELIDYRTTTKLTETEYATLCAMGLANEPMSIEFIPSHLLNNAGEMITALEKDWRVLKFLPDSLVIEQQVYKDAVHKSQEAVRQDSKYLQYIPESLLDDAGYQAEIEKILERLSRREFYEFIFIPAKYRTKSLCLQMIEKGYESLIELIKNPTNRSREISDRDFKEICVHFIKKFKKLESIPTECLDEELCFEAVMDDVENLKYVPVTINNYEKICHAAVQKNKFAIRHVSPHLLSYKTLCFDAIEENPLVIEFIDKNNKSYNEFFLKALKKDGAVLKFACHDHHTLDFEKLCLEAVEQNGLAIQHVPRNISNYEECCLAAFKENYLSFSHFPQDIHNYEFFCFESVKKHYSMLAHIPETFYRYYEVCLEAVKSNWQAIQHVSNTVSNYEKICEEAANISLRAIEFIKSPSDEVLRAAERSFLKEIDSDNKPVIILIYIPEDGTTNTDAFIDYLNQKGIQPYLISAHTAFLSPLFKPNFIDKIDGIVLPGGPHISLSEPRTKLEIKLLDTAIKHKIPTLGICRGHQLIGHYFGAEVQNLSGNHQGGDIIVKSKAIKGETESKLYTRLDQKHSKIQAELKNSISNDKLIKNEQKNSYTYQASCMHSQHIFFKNKNRDKKNIRIVARAKDKTIEAMEVGNHIISFQHHLELRAKRQDRIAKTVLNSYKKMVLDHYTTRTQKKHQYKN